MKEEIKKMLKQGIIRESRSFCHSPIGFLGIAPGNPGVAPGRDPVMVPKADGTLWICINFCRFNIITQFDTFPMPQVGELLQRIGQAQFISTFNLTKGYWQIPLCLEDRAKRAFGTCWGLYEFCRMPFGLSGAAVTFQRLTDWVLALHHDYATAYIDNIMVYTKTWDQHVRAVQAVLQEVKQVCLMAHLNKCALGAVRNQVSGVSDTTRPD